MFTKIKNALNKTIDFLVKYRFLIAIVVFAILVLCKISGSSIGYYDTILTEKNDESVNYQLYGEARGIRSDEWLVMTPYNISQTYNNLDVNSNLMSLSGQNMIIGYNSPVKDLTILAKPISWGYILFGPEYGLSWYWCGKLILFILLSFELCMIITKKDKKLSLLGALLVSFGPSTQWWFAPHMPDVILYFMAVAVFAYHLLSNKSKKIKNLMVPLLTFALLGYVIALFPSFQVGLGYFLVVLFIVLMIRDKNRFYKDKGGLIRIGIVAVLAILLIGYFLINNLDALKAVASTAYPGARVDTGGTGTFKDLFTDLSTPFLAHRENAPYNNHSEDSTYIHLGIFILTLLPILVNTMKKKKDRNYIVGIGMALVLVVYGIFLVNGFPEILAKLTFFGYINRMKMIFGFIAVLFTIWGFKAIKEHSDKIDKKYYFLAVFAFGLMNLGLIDGVLKHYMPVWHYYLVIAIFILSLIFIKSKHRSISYILLSLLIAYSSFDINPIITGTSAITNHPSSTYISEKINEDAKSYWLSYNSLTYQGYLISLGAKTINAVNFYPDFEKWQIIDPDNKYEEAWNRYAHIGVNFTNSENTVSAVSPDHVHIALNSETVYNLGVRYIVSNSEEDLTEFNSDKYAYEKTYSDASISIYTLKSVL